MLLCVENILSPQEVAHIRSVIDTAQWDDGRNTAGAQSAQT